jgi:ankyrin repeat protein
MFLDANSPVDSEDVEGATPLHVATKRDHKEVAELLLNAKADVNLQDKNGRTALYWAAWNGDTEVVTLLYCAVRSGDTKVLKLLPMSAFDMGGVVLGVVPRLRESLDAVLVSAFSHKLNKREFERLLLVAKAALRSAMIAIQRV